MKWLKHRKNGDHERLGIIESSVGELISTLRTVNESIGLLIESSRYDREANVLLDRRLTALEESITNLKRHVDDNFRANRNDISAISDKFKKQSDHFENIRKQQHLVNTHLGSIEKRLLLNTGEAFRPKTGETKSVVGEAREFMDLQTEVRPSLPPNIGTD